MPGRGSAEDLRHQHECSKDDDQRRHLRVYADAPRLTHEGKESGSDQKRPNDGCYLVETGGHDQYAGDTEPDHPNPVDAGNDVLSRQEPADSQGDYQDWGGKLTFCCHSMIRFPGFGNLWLQGILCSQADQAWSEAKYNASHFTRSWRGRNQAFFPPTPKYPLPALRRPTVTPAALASGPAPTWKDDAMQFSVIYSVDVPADDDVLDFAPPNVADWDETEDDDHYEYGYLEGRWEGGHHRKWCAILDREQFQEFVERCGLTAESTETLGSLGAPGCGWAGPGDLFPSDRSRRHPERLRDAVSEDQERAAGPERLEASAGCGPGRLWLIAIARAPLQLCTGLW